MNVSSVLEMPTIPNLMNWISTGARKRAPRPATLVGGPCGGVCSEFIGRKDERLVELRLRTLVEDGRGIPPRALQEPAQHREADVARTPSHPDPAERSGPCLRRGGARRGV